MKLYSEGKSYKLYEGNMLDMLDVIEPNSIDSIVTDPPYELNFMNKGWDNSGIAFQPDTWHKCYQVLKPGGYLLAFGGSRTSHRIACAIEDAGFEIRDTIMWLYGSGFPKSMSVSKGLEAREKLGNAGTRNKRLIEQACDTDEYTLKAPNNGIFGEIKEWTRKQYIPETELVKKWEGWGTALKPSYEPIIVARKPFSGSLVDNVLKYGVGGLNIDECRIGDDEITTNGARTNTLRGDTRTGKALGMFQEREALNIDHIGRFPANTILTYDDEDYAEVCGGMPYTSSAGGETTMPDLRDVGAKSKSAIGIDKLSFGQVSNADRKQYDYIAPADSGSAARYFYCAKASKKDRDDGLDQLQTKSHAEINGRQEGSAGATRAYGGGTNPFLSVSSPRKNTHPTVKPTELMQYLIRLVTPNGGTVLDPFNGSGSTGKAVMYENREKDKGYKYIGIELTPEYLPISKARIEYASDPNNVITWEETDEDTGETNKVSYVEVSLF